MSKMVFGDVDGSALTLYKGYPQWKLVGLNRYEITYRYWCAQNAVGGLIPAFRSACPLNWATDHKLMEASGVANGRPCLVDVELVYKYPGFVASRHQDGEFLKTANTSWVEVPIDDPRLITAGILSAQDVADQKARHYTTQGIGGVDYTYTTWSSSGTWTEAELTSGVGVASNPTGMTSPTAGAWLKVGITQRDDGDLTEKAVTWRYNQLGWP